MSRKAAREEAMKLIYQMDIKSETAQELLKDYYEEVEIKLDKEDEEYIDGCVKGVYDNLPFIDSYIERYSKGWKISRIAKVDLAIMRLSIYEMLERQDVPPAASVNEAIEISKIYCGDNSPAFINGVLGNIIRELEHN